MINLIESMGQTKYSRYYLNIISNSDNVNTGEIHHILPKSVYPQFSCLKKHPWNGKKLSYRQHFICHLLIWKHFVKIKHPGEKYMAKAVMFMSKNKKYNSRIYETIKSNLKFNYKKERIKIDISYLQKLLLEYKNINKVSKMLGVDRSVITNRIKRHNLIVGKCEISKSTDVHVDLSVLTTLLKHHPVKEISKIMDIPESTIRNRIKQHNLKVHHTKKISIDKVWLEGEIKTKNVRTISLESGIGEDTLFKWIRNFKLDYKMKNCKYYIDDKIITDLYEQGFNITEISTKLNVPWGVVSRKLKNLRLK